MWQLKPISKESIPQALERALRYRLLNEPMVAESIGLDILDIDPDNKEAAVIVFLALTDQLDTRLTDAFAEAQAALKRFHDEYSRSYYEGILCERRGKAHYKKHTMGAGQQAYEWIHRAMNHYDTAAKLRPSGNDESILRWNCCVRMLSRHADMIPRTEDQVEHMLE